MLHAHKDNNIYKYEPSFNAVPVGVFQRAAEENQRAFAWYQATEALLVGAHLLLQCGGDQGKRADQPAGLCSLHLHI